MGVLNVLIVDDEALARLRLRNLLADAVAAGAPLLQVEEAANAEQARAWLERRRFDLLLLDIHMPGAGGMHLARQVHSQAQAPVLIFVTADAGQALDAFEVSAVDYLTKPVRLQRLQAALQKAQHVLKSRTGVADDDEYLVVSERGGSTRVPLADICYFKAELKYLTVRTQAHHHVLDGSLAELESRLGARFVRVHRNALVARQAVCALIRHHDPDEGEGWAVRLRGVDEVVAVSRRHVAAVRDIVQGLT